MVGIGLFKEYNVYRPPRRYDLSIALVYPSTYSASITNLFTHIAYYFLNERLNALIDRFTMDNPTEGALTGYNLRKFDIVLASISFELDLPYLARILLSNGISPYVSRRGSSDPLIIIGGPPPTANPLPYSVIADAVFVGEGEALLNKLVELSSYVKVSQKWKERFVEELIKDGSSYSGILNNKVRRAHVSNLSRTYAPKYLIRSLKYEPVYGDGYYIEVSRGCKWLCSFCMEAFISCPYRFRGKDEILDLIFEGIKNVGKRRVVFYSLSFFDHPQADDILNELLENKVKFNVPSIRYTTLNENRIDLVLEGGQRTITIAPETLSYVASEIIRKELDKELLERLCTYVLRRRANLKLYFMLGLPCEGNAPKEIADFVNTITSKLDSLRSEQIRVAINPLIPKPSTPMQYLGLIKKEKFNHYLKDLLNRLHNKKYLRIDYYDWRWAYAQALIALGDRKAGLLAVKWGELGCGLGSLRRVIKELNIDDRYIYEVKEVNSILPWDEVIDSHLGGLVKSLGARILNTLHTC